jgi:DNA repair exonuclease SbcCD nuclease subunit
MLITADLHLDDKPENEYRWSMFDKLHQVAHKNEPIFILGDIADRADRHSGVLVNRLIKALTKLTDAGRTVTILCGNHDKSLEIIPYWSFLNNLTDIEFIITPTARDEILFLPYSSNPIEEWKDIDFKKFKCVMMHQTVTGVVSEAGKVLSASNMVSFSPDNIVYSGDIHTPQKVGTTTYVGAPHPVKFGDKYPCRFLRLDTEDYSIKEVISLPQVLKRVIEISSIEQLQDLKMLPGDQSRIRFTLPASDMENWPKKQEAISAWARECGVTLASVEAIIETSPETTSRKFDFDADPADVLDAFCMVEGVEESIRQTGIQLLTSQFNNRRK